MFQGLCAKPFEGKEEGSLAATDGFDEVLESASIVECEIGFEGLSLDVLNEVSGEGGVSVRK